MQGSFKYILVIILLLFTIRTAMHNSSLKENFKKDKIEFIETQSLDNIVINSKDYNYKLLKKNSYTEQEVYASFESLASKNLKFNNKTSHKLHNTKSDYSLKENNDPVYFRIVFDNDIFNNTDYYYTNGVRLEFVSPFLDIISIGRILPSLNNPSIEYSGISLVQNIYTPVNPDTKVINSTDRPFSAYLVIGLFHESINVNKGVKLFSELSVGVIGPASFGGKVQSSIHDIEPIGWENQINNDFYLNYKISVNKLIFAENNFELSAIANANIGTVYNKFGAGINMRFGKFSRFIENPLLKPDANTSDFSYWIFTRTKGNIVAYDATLQGGLFNKTNPYTVDKTMINNFVLEASAGIAIYYKSIGIELENFYLSPEFKGAYDFRYGRVNLIIGF